MSFIKRLYRRLFGPFIVKFIDGTYGVRYSNFLTYKFVDLKDPNFTWLAGDSFFSDCKGTYDECLKYINEVNDYGKVV